MSMDLHIDGLPDLPQLAFLKELLPKLWSEPKVLAIWLGGSFARGNADNYSDIDLRLALRQEDYETWSPDLEGLFGKLLAHQRLHFGKEALLHHLIAPNGDIYDLYIQSINQEPTKEARLVLACRDASFLLKLQQPAEESTIFPEAKAETIREIVEFYWLNTHKNRKVLYRDLDLLLWEGLNRFRPILLRLHYIRLSGRDCGDLSRTTIHAMTPVIRTLQTAEDRAFLELVGLATQTREDKIQAVNSLNREISKVGKLLFYRYAMLYPEALEALVLQGWEAFLQGLREAEGEFQKKR